ncbi:hypothetical protein [Streptomyces sp. BK022]|uniref:hypothetical protein n=1 Tax=Streptomyces sp. BK022 TaxID=2512123 RepID=UPI001028B705|nr:hypothetical protein [Streptomyces sp. BK022]
MRSCQAKSSELGELGQVTDALTGPGGMLETVRAAQGDVSEVAVELRCDIAMLPLLQGRSAETPSCGSGATAPMRTGADGHLGDLVRKPEVAGPMLADGKRIRPAHTPSTSPTSRRLS